MALQEIIYRVEDRPTANQKFNIMWTAYPCIQNTHINPSLPTN